MSPRALAVSPILFFLIAPWPALSQTANFQPAPADYSGGATLPPTSAALIDEATSPQVNPAGLAFMPGFGLSYLHERGLDRNLIADGVFVAGNLFGLLDLGFDIEWLRGDGPSRRRISWTLAGGSDFFSLGLTYRSFFSENACRKTWRFKYRLKLI